MIWQRSGFILLAFAISCFVNIATSVHIEVGPSNEEDGKIWISMASDLASKWLTNITHKILNNGITIAQVEQSNVLGMNYLSHKSLGGAIQFVEQLERVDPNHVFQEYKIDNPQQVAAFLREIKEKNLELVVNTFKKMHSRRSLSTSFLQASELVLDVWSKLIGPTRPDITVEFYDHQTTKQPSVVLTIPGNEEANDIVILGAHLDSTTATKNIPFPDPNERAPGADDDASGLSLLTECLRIMIKTGYKPKKTIQLMAFAAEEEGLVGSKDIAEKYRMENKNVAGMFQFDMIGYRGSEKDIYIVDDNTNQPQNTFLEKLMNKYMSDVTYDRMACNYRQGQGCSDHFSWYVQNYPDSAVFEAELEKMNPNYHTSNDSEVDASFMKNFVRLALAYIAELAKTSRNVQL